MISAGNDIIDLSKINIKRTKQVQFYSKILTDTEVELYSQCKLLPFESYVWLLWSIKESVYKFLKRHNHSLVFSPKKIVVTRVILPIQYNIQLFDKPILEDRPFNGNSCVKATVVCEDKNFYTTSNIFTNLVFTVVDEEAFNKNIYRGFKHIKQDDAENQSKQVRLFVLNRLAHLFPGGQFTFSKSPAGCPVLINNLKEFPIPLSLAHHGNYVGYAFYYNPVTANIETYRHLTPPSYQAF